MTGGAAHRPASSSFTSRSIKSRTSRNWSSCSSFGSGMFQSSPRFAFTRGQESPQPIVTATSTSVPMNASRDFDA